MKIPRISALVTAFLLFFSLPPMPSVAQDCLATGCHQSLTVQKNPHQPAADGECLACHEQKDPQHPSMSGTSFTLSAPGASLCAQCHELEPKGKIHPPVAAGDCLACHDPHGSANRHLLKAPIPDLCLECHPDISTAIKAKSKHAAMYRDESCVICHSGHSSSSPALLVANEKELCLSCHSEDDYTRSDPLRNIGREIEGKPYLHGPVADGECSPCHAPHGSPFYRLLREDYPSGPYAPYTKETYALCFECHDRSMLSSSKATADTAFRNGSRNLHYLHVADPRKGRVCTTCHASHASTSPKLLKENGTSFGNWTIPVNFKPTGTGGSCAPGCHKAVQYDRTKP